MNRKGALPSGFPDRNTPLCLIVAVRIQKRRAPTEICLHTPLCRFIRLTKSLCRIALLNVERQLIDALGHLVWVIAGETCVAEMQVGLLCDLMHALERQVIEGVGADAFAQLFYGVFVARELVFVGGDELDFEFNFIIGVYDKVGDWAPGRGAHVHPFDECLLFFGYDPQNMSYLGADMSLCLGREWEKHYFNTPMAIPAPRGMPHCPLVTEKVHKAFGHFHLALSGKYAADGVKQAGTTEGKKYAHMFKPMVVKTGPGGADMEQYFEMSGNELEGLGVNFKMGLHTQPGEWQQGAGMRSHPYDQCLVFFGHNTDDLSYLGAEISLAIGPEHEKHTFDVPTAVALPHGTQYGALTCHKLEKPNRVMQIGLAPDFQSEPITTPRHT
jgi:hypothetical protein